MDPKPLEDWLKTNQVGEYLNYKERYWDQVNFVQDILMTILFPTKEEEKKHPVMVINTHHSKTFELPVYRIELANGMKFTMRCNFYDWKISVDSLESIDIDFLRIIKEREEISSCSCEGFPEEIVFGAYADNNKQFTFRVGWDYMVFTFFWILCAKKLVPEMLKE